MTDGILPITMTTSGRRFLRKGILRTAATNWSIIWRYHRCIVIHPGIKGDRGPSALDWAVQNGEREWGVTALEANGDRGAEVVHDRSG